MGAGTDELKFGSFCRYSPAGPTSLPRAEPRAESGMMTPVCDLVDALDTELSRDSIPVPSFFFFLKSFLRELLKEWDRDFLKPSSGISWLPNSSET